MKLNKPVMALIKSRQSLRLLAKHTHPYVLCIIDIQPRGFGNANFIVGEILKVIQEAIQDKAFIIIAQFYRCGETHEEIRSLLADYAYKEYFWHKKNDKSKPFQEIINKRGIFIREIKVCGINTEYCVKDTVHGLSRKFHSKSIKVIEKACHGTDRTVETALHKMRTFYRNVNVV
jgi:nicotinamidase-related amidase